MADTLIQGTTIIEDKRSEKGEVWSCAGSDFNGSTPDTDDITLSSGDDGSLLASADGITCLKGVNIPNGATIKEVVVYGDAAASAETYFLYRRSIDSGIGAGATIMATANIGTVDEIINKPIINNEDFCYWLQTTSIDTGDEIWGARIKYEF